VSLQRFHQAQDDSQSGYANALEEIRSGQKTSHWIWYIFPQISGLGRSSMAQDYAIRDLEEAFKYLEDPTLRARYIEISEAILEKLNQGSRLTQLMGSPIDALKLISSLTLFREAEKRSIGRTLADSSPITDLCDRILGLASHQGFPVCLQTLQHLG
jgi:uncharacterized protein (DUF1810 family)